MNRSTENISNEYLHHMNNNELNEHTVRWAVKYETDYSKHTTATSAVDHRTV